MRTAESGITKEDMRKYEVYWSSKLDLMENNEKGKQMSSGKTKTKQISYEYIDNDHIDGLRKTHHIY